MDNKQQLIRDMQVSKTIIGQIAYQQGVLDNIENAKISYEEKHQKILKGVSRPIKGLACIAGIFLGFIWGAILCFIACQIIDIPFKKKRKAKAITFYETQIVPLFQKEEETVEKLAELWQSKQATLAQKLIPEEYARVGVVAQLIKLIENQRADTLKEAINLYEDILHKRRLEIMQQQQVELAQATLQAQKELTTSSSQVAQSINQQINISQRQVQISEKLRSSSRYGNVLNTINTVHHWTRK